MMLKIFLRARAFAHTGFGFCEHLCAFGYALSEFRFRVAEVVLYYTSIGLCVTAIAVVADLSIRHVKKVKLKKLVYQLPE
jgi:hypothetical protein